MEDVNLVGPGRDNSCITGLDLHTVQDVTIKNVEITGYSKNGVGVTAPTSFLSFENVTIEDNGYTGSTGWAGISFYTMLGGDITDVQFLGTNTISNNPIGVYVENIGGNVFITGGSATLLGNDIPLVATKFLGIPSLSIVDAYARDVFNVPIRLENAFADLPNSMIVGYWHDVTSAGMAANNPSADGNPVIFNLTNGEWYVVAGINMNIQAAITAASNGDTINVTAGTYNENVLVNKNVTLKSAEELEAEVVGVDYSGDVFRITADGATVEGFLVIIAAAHDGIAVKADGVTVRNNKVKGPGPFTGYVPPTGAGISVMIANDVTVEGNSVHETSGAGIYMEAVSDCTVTDNKVVETQYTGILIWWHSHDNTITGNRVTSAGTEWCYDDGIRLGFRADDNTVEHNRVNSSIRHGIHAAPPSSGNIIQYNMMRGNGIPATGGVDARDRSTGIGTAGTANWWTGNNFRTSDPDDLE